MLVFTTFSLCTQSVAETLDLVVITARKNLSATLCDFEGNCVYDIQMSSPDIVLAGSGDKTPADKLKDLVKKGKNACRRSSETCAAWGARMIAPVVLDSNGKPTGLGMGLCTSALFFATSCQLNILELTQDDAFCAAIQCPEA